MRTRFIHSFVVAVVLLAGIVIGQASPVQDALAQSGIGNWDIPGAVIFHGNVTVADGNDLTLTDDLTVADDFSVADDLTITDDLIISGDIGPTRQTTVTVTNGGTVTPLGAYVPLSSAGAVGTSSIAGCTAGVTTGSKLVLFENVGAQTITFTDTGTLKLSGNAALSAFDTLILLCDTGSGNWIQMAPEGDN